MISPRSTYGRKASCCALLKRWISSMNRMVRRPGAAQALGVGHHRLDLLDAAQHRAEGDEIAARQARDQPRQGGLAHARRSPQNDGASARRARSARRSGFPGPQNVLLADEVFQAVPAACAPPAAASRHSRRSSERQCRTGSWQQRSLPPRLVQQNAGGHRRVQRFHADGGNRMVASAAGAQFGADAASFVADDEGHRPDRSTAASERGFLPPVPEPRRTIPRDSVRAPRAPGPASSRCKKRHPEQRTGRSPERLGVEWAHRALEENRARGTETLRPPAGWRRRCRGPASRPAPPPAASRETGAASSTPAVSPAPSRPAPPRCRSRLANNSSGRTAILTPFLPRTCASAADSTEAATSTSFTSQSLRSASSSRWKVSATQQPLCGEAASPDGPPHIFDQGVGRAGDRFRSGHRLQ